MVKSTDSPVDRRVFLKQAVAGAAALTSTPAIAGAPANAAQGAAAATGAPEPAQAGAAREADVLTQATSGSDYMLDVFKSLGLDYVCANPGSSFRGLHESVVNHGGNSRTELITCCHEESSVAIADGYFRVEGKPMAVMLLEQHATVTICHSRTRDLGEWTRRADILVVAIGRPSFISGAMIKPSAVVIDVGMNRLDDGSLVGDVDNASAREVAGSLTPVPGGVGPMTVTMVLHNTVAAARALYELDGASGLPGR